LTVTPSMLSTQVVVKAKPVSDASGDVDWKLGETTGERWPGYGLVHEGFEAIFGNALDGFIETGGWNFDSGVHETKNSIDLAKSCRAVVGGILKIS
jgi:hypothetical protein